MEMTEFFPGDKEVSFVEKWNRVQKGCKKSSKCSPGRVNKISESHHLKVKSREKQTGCYKYSVSLGTKA